MKRKLSFYQKLWIGLGLVALVPVLLIAAWPLRMFIMSSGPRHDFDRVG